MKKRLLIISLTSLALTGCLVGPKYKRDKAIDQNKSPKSYSDTSVFANPKDTVHNLKWFNLFNDKALTALIDTGLKNNYDMRIAISHIEQANAQYGYLKADLLPNFGYNLGARRTNLTNDPRSNDATFNYFNISGTVSWEIDLWGKIRHSKRGALNDYLASIETQKGIQIQLISDIATLYFKLRDIDNRIIITKRTIESRQASYDILTEQFNKGYIGQLDVFQLEQLLRDAEASLPNFERQRTIIEQSIDILLGQPYAPIVRGIENAKQPLPPPIPSGLPSTLLEQRPDVKAAEYKYKAENERIGVANAQRFPSFSLTGLLGVASTDVTTMLTGDALRGQLAAGLVGPIFNFGKNRRRVEIQRKEAEIAMINYQKAYTVALTDVEVALVSCKTLRDENEARAKQANAASQALKLSQARYDNGYVSYLEVLDSQRNLFNSEITASTTKQQQLNAYVQLYKALGGGW